MSFRALLGALACAAFPVLATPQPIDATDMWFDPAESGWGLNLIHQGNTLFATLFVYGVDRQPKWFVASDVSGGPATYTGTLRECTGPWFGGAFASRPVNCRDVGTLRFEPGAGSGVVDYTVDGVRVVKQVQRFTFRLATPGGAYEAYLFQPGTSPTDTVNQTDLTWRIRDNGPTVSMDTTSDSRAPCDWTGTQAHNGQYVTINGSYQCSGGSSGPFTMTVNPAAAGFTGTFSGAGIGSGRIAAARFPGTQQMQGMGWRNDMWFVPSESGWGLNVIEQGDTLFATLFTYDAQGRSRWYVASSLAQQGDAADGRVTYAGALHEATGPYFAGAFDPAAVAPRQVGQMSFQAAPDGTASLSYTVDGVQVAKQVQRFAFRKQDFSGSYLGSYAHDRQADMVIDDAGSEFRMQLVDRFGGMGTCQFVAPYAQLGSLRLVSGTYTCGTRTGSFTLRDATVSAHGFTARFDSPMFDFRAIVDGHIAGVRR